MSVRRPMGLETEYGLIEPGNVYANPIALSHALVTSYATKEAAQLGRTEPVRWDYAGEDPLRDARGFRVDRSLADPSLLTDDPEVPAAPGPDLMQGVELGSMRRPTEEERWRPSAASVVLANGARLYVDHAHPEYSGPETMTPREAVLWDRAGDEILAQAMTDASRQPTAHEVVVYKNNVDGKGATYGTHENYLLDRDIRFEEIVAVLTPFFVTRPLFCGSGRVGLGQRSETPGFQISQRADYVEAEVGLETTFNRPIVNTRDEPHADPTRFRRLHVIGGDATLFDVSTYLRVGTTSVVLWLLEQMFHENEDLATAAQRACADLKALSLTDPVSATHQVSRDLTLAAPLSLRSGEQLTALQIQRRYLQAVQGQLDRTAAALGVPIDEETGELMRRWEQVLGGLQTDIFSVAAQVEWVAKYQLLDRLREREGGSWAAPRVVATDLQWHDLRPQRSIVARLDAAGRVERLVSLEQVYQAVSGPPTSTRAYLRGQAIQRYAGAVLGAGWASLLLDLPHREDIVRIPMPDPRKGTAKAMSQLLDASPTAESFLTALTGS